MEEAITFRGRQIGPQQIEFLRDLIARHPEASRRRLSELVCEEWDWRQANGVLCSMVCRSLMLLLHRAGHIELPPPRSQPVNPLAKRRRPVLEEAIDQSPIIAKLKDLRSLLRIERSVARNPISFSMHWSSTFTISATRNRSESISSI